MAIKLYILVRTDKSYSVGKLLVHSSHVGSELVYKYLGSSSGCKINSWILDHFQTKIILSVPHLATLDEYNKHALNMKLCTAFVPDAGFYEVEEGEILMCGILCDDDQAKELGLNKLKLYKGENVV